MHFGSLILVSGLLILLGTMIIAILFAASEQASTFIALVLAAGISGVIAVYNYMTISYSSASTKNFALAMGVLAVIVALISKKKPGWVAKVTISSTILIGLTQLILVH